MVGGGAGEPSETVRRKGQEVEPEEQKRETKKGPTGIEPVLG